MRDNIPPSRDYYVYYVVHTGTGVYPDLYPVGTENSIRAYTAIAILCSLPFGLPPRLTMREVIPPLPKIFVFLIDEQLRQFYLYSAEREKCHKGEAKPCTGLERHLGFQEVETPRISRKTAHESGKVVSPTPRPPLPPPPGDTPGIYFCWGARWRSLV